MTREEEYAVIRRVCAGDSDAFEALVTAYQKQVYNLAQRTCTVWLIGSDIVFRTGEDGPYYLTQDAADTFRQLLNLRAG